MASNLPNSDVTSILLVEDNPGDVRLVQEAFREIDTEAEFHVATDGKEALTYLQERLDDESLSSPDLLLLDLNLPRVDGFEVLDEIRSNQEYPPLPILILSSSDARDDVMKSYEHSANAYLTKPDDPADLVTVARTIEQFWLDTATLPSVPL